MDFVTTKIWKRLVTAIILVLGMSPGSQQLSRSHILASLTLHLAGSSTKRTSVISDNKHQSQLSATPVSFTKRTPVSPAKKQQSQISFISTRKERTKHSVSSTIRRKRKITTHNDDSDDDDGGNVDGGSIDGRGKFINQHTRRPKRSCCWFVMNLFASSLFYGTNFQKRNILNLVTIQYFSYQILRLYVICECIIWFCTFKTPFHWDLISTYKADILG